MRERLQIKVFGQLTLSFQGASARPAGRKAQALLGYLALSDTPQATRERLVGLLWSESPDKLARGALRQSLRELQSVLRAISHPELDATKNTISVDKDSLEVDLWDVLAASRLGEVHPLLLTGPRITDTILADLDGVHSVYDTWLRDARAAIREQLISNLAKVLPHDDDDTLIREAEEVAARAIALLDPAHEASARAIIRARWQAGDVGSALGTYQRLWQYLEEEFDTEPSIETQSLVAKLRLEQPETIVPVGTLPPLNPSNIQMPGGYEARPSIAVLPFETLGTTDKSYFGDGIVYDIIQTLAGLSDLLVISKGSTLHYRAAAPDIKTVGRELGVQYVLHGSVQRSGNRLRIHTILAEADTAAIIKTARYDGDLSDLFHLQDQIALETTKMIAPSVRERELKRAMRKHPQSLTAYEYLLQAVGPLHELEHTAFASVPGLLGKAIDLDPTYAPAFAALAHWHCYRIGQMWSTDMAADMREAERYSDLAIKLDHTNATALAVTAHVKCIAYRDYEGSRENFRRALAEGPNSAFAWTLSAVTESCAGRGAEGVRHARIALRLSPRDSFSHYPLSVLAQSHFVAGEFRSAVEYGRASLERNKRFAANLRILAASLVEIGELNDARAVVAQHLQLVPNFSLRSWTERTWLSPGVRDHVAINLQRAGMPA